MSSMHAAPLLLSILVGLVIGVVAWGFIRFRGQETGDPAPGTRDDFLLGLLVLAAFAMGVFLTYLLLTPSL